VTIDPNMVSDNQYVGLSPLTLDDVRNFFNTYIKPFAPYQEEKVYDTLINTLVEYYYNQTYTNIPKELKEIFEETNINSVEVYNKLLIAIGVPNEIINNISTSNKIVFLKTLSDFQRYKGTVSFFQKVVNAFSDRVSIYELFIDLEGSNWVFKPVRLYLHDEMTETLNSIPYETVRRSIPSLLLSEEQLTSLYEDEKLILPIKSNLLLLDNDLMADVSVLYDVIVAIFLHTYKDNYVDVYFSDNSQVVQLKTIYFLWYYLLTRYYGMPWTSFAATFLLRFTYDNIGFPAFIGTTPTTISNLYQIIDRYDEIRITNSTNRDFDHSHSLRDSFYKDISKAFYTFDSASATTFNDMYNSLVIMNSSLISYIDDRIVNSSIGANAEINLILTEIYSSLVLYSTTYSGDSYFGEYADYFLRYLPQILINPESTTSYTIMYNLKPYHVELYSSYSTGIRCQDKFNSVYVDDETDLKFLCELTRASVLSFSDDRIFKFVKHSESSVSPVSIVTFNIGGTFVDDSLNFLDYVAFKEFVNASSIETISDSYLFSVMQNLESAISMLSVCNFSTVTIPPDELLELLDADTFKTPLLEASFSNISDDYVITKVP